MTRRHEKSKCEYCNSLFAQEELDAMKPMQGEEPEAAAQERAAQAAAGAAAGAKAETGQTVGEREKRTGGRGGVLQLSVLRRRDCATDAERAAATFCYYCHNPVVLDEKTAGRQLSAE